MEAASALAARVLCCFLVKNGMAVTDASAGKSHGYHALVAWQGRKIPALAGFYILPAACPPCIFRFGSKR
ncbi:hypothetical protein [Comamonas terrae]|uniref:hypothetical protein n=1 Tax=Comamonas terrae TaxID=673548 RepID=UPI001C3F276F|nr:hypothetical protein [Comamonas terrae]